MTQYVTINPTTSISDTLGGGQWTCLDVSEDALRRTGYTLHSLVVGVAVDAMCCSVGGMSHLRLGNAQRQPGILQHGRDRVAEGAQRCVGGQAKAGLAGGKRPAPPAASRPPSAGRPTEAFAAVSLPPGVACSGHAGMEADAPDCPTRDTPAVASGSFARLLQKPFGKGTTQGTDTGGNGRLDPADGGREPAVGRRADPRRVIEAGHPTDAWIAQQLREATPFGVRPHYLIRDNDSKYGPKMARVAATSRIEILRTPVRAPPANAIRGRFDHPR